MPGIGHCFGVETFPSQLDMTDQKRQEIQMPQSRHTYAFPTRMEYGPGAMLELPAMVKESGCKKGLLVTDVGIEAVGTAQTLRTAFQAAGIQLTTYSGVKSNPTDDNVFEGTQIYKESDSEFIVSLGGGSPIDVGKTIKIMATHAGPLTRYDDSRGGSAHIQANMPPFYAIPTTAGTGSEVGRSSVISIRSTGTKTIIFSPFLMPTIAVLDPEITVSLPARLTAATGVDAFVHNLEAYLMDTYHPFADALAKEGIYRCFKYLPAAVKQGTDIRSRGEMLMASAMGATAFQKGLGLNHAIAHALSVFYDTHHGLANAAVLIGVMRYNLSDAGVKRKIASLAPLVNADDGAAETVLNKISEWLVTIGMPTNLSGLGIDADDIAAIEAYALADPCCPLNPKEVSKGDVIGILERLL
jgi:alcohol dehydrogenase class IV